MPPKTAPTAYAESFVLTSDTPIMLAANSSSRMASHARPSRPRRIRSETNTQNATTSENTRNRYGRSNGPSAGLTPLSFEKMPVPIGSIGVMPFVPLVMLICRCSLSPFVKNCGMISPKPRVTIAR